MYDDAGELRQLEVTGGSEEDARPALQRAATSLASDGAGGQDR
ncbi:hypothetical protein [Microbacterium helvum]|nr:hypothetical protein [Microbacterium helvum]